MGYLELPTKRRALYRYGGIGQLPTKRRGLWRYGGLGADDPMIFCCPNDTIRHPASYCKTQVCEKPLSRALPGADDMMYCCPGDTVMRPKSRCRTIECAGAPALTATPSAPVSMPAAPIMTPPVEPAAEEPVYYALPYSDTSDLDARRAALAERQAALAAQSAELRAKKAPLKLVKPAAKQAVGPPALSIGGGDAQKYLLIAAAIGGGLWLLNAMKKGK